MLRQHHFCTSKVRKSQAKFQKKRCGGNRYNNKFLHICSTNIIHERSHQGKTANVLNLLMASSDLVVRRFVKEADFQEDLWMFIFRNINQTFNLNSIYQYFKEFSSIVLTNLCCYCHKLINEIV